MRTTLRNGFTLVEILVVVVILGILAALVVPQYSRATQDAKTQATLSQLVKIRDAIRVYYYRNANTLPNVTAGSATWGELMSDGYFKFAPDNIHVGGAAGKIITVGVAADTASTSAYGWVYNPATGDVWAASFDANDEPLP